MLRHIRGKETETLVKIDTKTSTGDKNWEWCGRHKNRNTFYRLKPPTISKK